MPIILEVHRQLDNGTRRKTHLRWKNDNNPEFYDFYEGNLHIRLGHLPKDVTSLLVPERLVFSPLFNEYTQPISLEIGHRKVKIWENTNTEEDRLIAMYTNDQLANFYSDTDHKPGIEFALIEPNKKDSYARLVESKSFRNPPVRFGSWTFRSHELRKAARK